MTLSIGIDLAKMRDRTALVFMESYPKEDVSPKGRPRHQVHHRILGLAKTPRGLDYPAQIEMIVDQVVAWAAEDKVTLWVDDTGPGKAVVDMLRLHCPLPIRGITIGTGSQAVQHGQDATLPKALLVGVMEAAIASRRLHGTRELPRPARPKMEASWEDLDKELRSFGYQRLESGTIKYEAQKGHDDMVIALALAIWGGHKSNGAGRAFLDHWQATSPVGSAKQSSDRLRAVLQRQRVREARGAFGLAPVPRRSQGCDHIFRDDRCGLCGLVREPA